MPATAPKPLPIPISFQWKNPDEKSWVVTGLRPGGICEIHQVGRHVTGEMNARDIRAAIEAGTAVQMETTDEARAILRRCRQ